MTMAERIPKTKRKHHSETDKYMNCAFILGSAAEVERLWSVAGHILSNNRKSMTPLLFDCLTFLKIDSTYWDVSLGSEAIKISRSDKVRKLMANHCAAGQA